MSKIYVCLLIYTGFAAAQKNYKDPAESGLFDAAVKDLTANSFDKAIADLDAWNRKYPDSEFKDDRQVFYVLAYAGAKQPEKALNAAAELVANPASLDTAKQVRLLYTAAIAIQQIPNPTPEQLATGGKAARDLAAFNKVPEGMSADQWASTRVQLYTAARAAMLYVALVPGTKALQTKDCAAASGAFRKALEEFPDSAQAAGYLGEAELCRARTEPDRALVAIYELARAASLDPVKGMVEASWQKNTVEPALERIYNSYHGADAAGLAQLKQDVLKSPLPPDGFTVQTAAQIAQQKQANFEAQNPELALWSRLKEALVGADGEQYFEANVKDAALPQLRGVVVDAKPACRPTELLIAVVLPNAAAPPPEIALKLAKPLSGKADLNTEIRWEGIATAFMKNPFLLTVETESAKIHGLNASPCTRR